MPDEVVKCPIWGTPAQLDQTRGFDGMRIYSHRAGGRYEISGTAVAVLENKPESSEKSVLKRKLSTWIYERQGDVEIPKITADILDRVATYSESSPVVKAERLLRMLNSKTKFIGVAALKWGPNVKEGENDRNLACAAAELSDPTELIPYLEFLQSKGWLDLQIDDPTWAGTVWVTVDGAEQAFLRTNDTRNSRAFVAMWFSSETQAAFDAGIDPAVRAAGYEPVRIDRKEHNNKIDDEIIAEIRASRFLIADFTCGTFETMSGDTEWIPRGGVYFEAGFAAGLGIPVIWCVRESQIGLVHFDTRQYNHITWKDPEDLRVRLENRIKATLGVFAEGKP